MRVYPAGAAGTAGTRRSFQPTHAQNPARHGHPRGEQRREHDAADQQRDQLADPVEARDPHRQLVELRLEVADLVGHHRRRRHSSGAGSRPSAVGLLNELVVRATTLRLPLPHANGWLPRIEMLSAPASARHAGRCRVEHRLRVGHRLAGRLAACAPVLHGDRQRLHRRREPGQRGRDPGLVRRQAFVQVAGREGAEHQRARRPPPP